MIIFDEQGVKVILRDGIYYLGGEDGGHQPEYLEIEISKEDATKVMEDVLYSTQLVLDYQNKQMGLI